jgi:hypothetical protein
MVSDKFAEIEILKEFQYTAQMSIVFERVKCYAMLLQVK